MQSRRARTAQTDTGPDTGQGGGNGRSSGGAGYWPAVAVIAIIVATAGWTTVAVMSAGGGSGAVAESPAGTAEDDLTASDEGLEEPAVELHEIPDLEALLPTVVAETPLTTESLTGATLLDEGSPWTEAVLAFLSAAGKTPADLQNAQAYDPEQGVDYKIGVFRLADVPPAEIREALVSAWKTDYPELLTSTVDIGGVEVTKGDFGPDSINSYWLVRDDLLFEIESSDEAIVASVAAWLADPSSAPAPVAPAPTTAPPAVSASPS